LYQAGPGGHALGELHCVRLQRAREVHGNIDIAARAEAPPRGRSVQQMRAAALLEQWAERNRRMQSDESLRKVAATKMRFQSNQGRRLHGRHATFLRAGSCRRPAPGTAMRGGERMNLAG
jgi:hypothetical protein